LFTPHCSLATQLEDLYEALQDRQQRIMSDSTAPTSLIPRLVWAITEASRDFYSQICKRSDVDPPDDGTRPTFAVAEISIYTSLFKAGLPIEVANMPEQWKRRITGIVTPSTQPIGRGGNDKRHGTNPFRATEGGDDKVNPSQPKVFADSADLKKVKNKIKNLTLTDICKEIGLNTPGDLDMTGLPEKVCLNYIIMGVCKRGQCKNDHDPAITDEAALALSTQLAPGIKHLAETGKRTKGK
jgi:hypothetical protein